MSGVDFADMQDMQEAITEKFDDRVGPSLTTKTMVRHLPNAKFLILRRKNSGRSLQDGC
jgi:hypothetical protein